MVNKRNHLVLMFICILMTSCVARPIQSNDIEKYKMYNPNCIRDSQHIPMPERFDGIEWQEKFDIAKLCQSLGY